MTHGRTKNEVIGAHSKIKGEAGIMIKELMIGAAIIFLPITGNCAQSGCQL
jgi:hypothetical protein